MPRASFQIIPQEPIVFPDYGKDNCVYCGEPLPKYKRKYCCYLHGLRYRLESSDCRFVTWDEVRSAIFKRDNHTCMKCGYKYDRTKGHITDQIQCDHIIPIALGGAEFNFDNLQTLCIECHKAKTREDVGKMADERRAEAEKKIAEQEEKLRHKNDKFWQSYGIEIQKCTNTKTAIPPKDVGGGPIDGKRYSILFLLWGKLRPIVVAGA